MIPVKTLPEPENFDRKARQPGLQRLKENPHAQLKDYWSHFKANLAEGFKNLCGYSATYEPIGTVDHFLSSKHHRELAYEWSNYRFASAWMNSVKRNADDTVLDPFEVEPDWFEILLPSLQLVVSPTIPDHIRPKAQFTLQRLKLRDSEQMIRQRQEWYRLYQEQKLTLEGLRDKAPLIAAAVERKSETSKD